MAVLQKQVVICTDGIFPHAVGGMQRHSRLLVEHLAKNHDWEIVVLHPHPENVFQHPKVKEERISPIDQNKNYLRECYAYSKRVYQVLQKYPAAVIYAQGLSVWYKASEFSDRLVINPHGLEPYQAMGTKDKLVAVPFKFVFGKLFRKAHKVVSLGGNLTKILSKIVPASKIAVLANGVMPRETSPNNFDQRPFKMLFVARFAHNKGIHILLDAVQQLNAEGHGKNFEFHLVGKGPLFEHYKNSISSDNVVLHGFVDDNDLEGIYKKSDAMVFPTLFEGMPTVILEAMAFGMPVIASNTGAIAELVDQQNGWLIPRGDVNALKQALREFMASSGTDLQNMSKASINKVNEQFTWDKVTASHVRLFESMRSGINE